jgi:ABC-2 type transport system ATP-binding protein
VQSKLDAVPEALSAFDLTLSEDGRALVYSYDTKGERTGITQLLTAVAAAGLTLKDVQTQQSSLEDIFVSLVSDPEDAS